MSSQLLGVLLLLPMVANAQDKGYRIIPEVGLSILLEDFKGNNVSMSKSIPFGLNIDKVWRRFGFGLYGGINKNKIQYDNLLPTGNLDLSISRTSENNQRHWQQFQFALGPIFNFNISKKFNLKLTSKFGFSKISYPDLKEFVEIGSPLNQKYTLYETNNENIGSKLRPMIHSAARLNYKLTKKLDLCFSVNYNHVRNVTHSYSYLDGDFSPQMTNQELITALMISPTVTEIRKCHFNSIGAAIGIGFNISQPKENPEKEIPDEKVMPDSCLSSLIRNEGFRRRRGRTATTAFWSTGYGAPKFLNTFGEGFFDPGYVELSGNQTTGSAAFQTLDANNKFISGKKYVINIGVKFQQALNTLNYARVRVIAYNGTLPISGSHPAPDQNISIIGRTGRIKDCGDWSIIELPVWTANKSFDKIAINVFTNDGTHSTLLIDNVSVCEVSQWYGCDTIGLDASNKPIIPSGYGNLPPGYNCIPEEEEDEYNNGTLQDLYGQLYGYDGTTNWYANAKDKCFSLGGTLPDEVLKYNCDDSLKLAGINMTCEEFQKLLTNPDIDKLGQGKLPYMPPLGTVSDTCEVSLPSDFGNMAFGGKDIIYVHGLELGHVVDRIQQKPGAMANWPDDPYEFTGGGYYQQAANTTWANHIFYFATNKNYQNRYLVVSYNCSQRLEVGIHSVLSQIREAMEHGTGVVVPNSHDPRGRNCFGREYVIISQSTGAIVSDVVLALADNTMTDPSLAAQYGNIGLIADRCRGHIARRGAFTGSDLATILVTLGNASSSAVSVAAAFMTQQSNSLINVNPYTPIIGNSILVDLIPSIARSKWGPLIDQVPVPVLTVTGGHPTFFSQNDLILMNLSGLIGVPPQVAQTVALGMKHVVHPGYDDGVITMDCATGRKSTYGTPSFIHPSSQVKLFDMGIPTARGISYFIDQRLLSDPSKFGSASTPYLSPTGMVQPVASVFLNPSYNNHYSFIQTTSEHWIKKHPLSCCDYNTTAIGGSANNEEELVVDSVNLFHPVTGIIDISITSQMVEIVKGRYIWVPTIKYKKIGSFYVPYPAFKEFYIWKRTYHKFRNDTLFDCDYVYRYIFNN